MQIKIVSWNVNGIRACERKGFLKWRAHQRADIICIQETKAEISQLNIRLVESGKYHLFFFSARKKGYSGVAIYSSKRLPLPKITMGLNNSKYNREGRTIIAHYPHFILFCCYFPNGGRDHSRVGFKLAYSRAILKQACQLHKETKKEIIIAGDVNTAHREIDLKNPSTNQNTSGFLAKERRFIDQLLEKGFYDIFRYLHPDKKDCYTWWSYRNDCRKRNIGWRIDYFFITKGLLKKVLRAEISHQIQGSDHCPILLELKF